MKKRNIHTLLNRIILLHRMNFFSTKNMIKKFLTALFLCFLCIFFSMKALSAGSYQDTLQTDIASQIIRFHVIANSDTTEDQALKLKVKSAVTQNLNGKLSDITDVNSARLIIEQNLDSIVTLAEEVIRKNGFDYPVTAALEKGYFPLKVYGDLTLPPGQYEALRIEIGKAKGQNWWCIMFPPLCFVDATYSVVPKESKEQLKEVLTDAEYEAVFSKEKPDIVVKSKILDFLKDYFTQKR